MNLFRNKTDKYPTITFKYNTAVAFGYALQSVQINVMSLDKKFNFVEIMMVLF